VLQTKRPRPTMRSRGIKKNAEEIEEDSAARPDPREKNVPESEWHLTITHALGAPSDGSAVRGRSSVKARVNSPMYPKRMISGKGLRHRERYTPGT